MREASTPKKSLKKAIRLFSNFVFLLKSFLLSSTATFSLHFIMILRLAANTTHSLLKRTMSSHSVSCDDRLFNRVLTHFPFFYQKALVVGIFSSKSAKGEAEKSGGIKLTAFGQSVNEKSNGKLLSAINT